MSLLREIPPTAGFPFYAGDILSLFSGQAGKGSLEEDFQSYLGVPFARVTYSGTAAFYFILEAIKTLSPKRTIIIPAFICPLIPLAIKRAGLKILVCDIQKDNFNFDSRQLRELCLSNPDILAIVAVHLGGIPVDFDSMQEITRENKIFIIEDCAQSLGAMYKNKKTGALGDFSFFSLCRGKGLTIYEGGVIVTGETAFAPLIEKTIQRLSHKDPLSEGLKILELFGYWLFYRPRLFWFVFNAPRLFWSWRRQPERAAGEYYTPDFPLHAVSEFRKRIGHLTFTRLDQEINKQRQRVSEYLKLLEDIPGIHLITAPAENYASYPYLTLLFDHPSQKNKAAQILAKTGLGVSIIYLAAINDYAYLKDIIPPQDAPNARYLAQRHISLSTSTFLTKADLDRIAKILS
ncbi:MAG: DegT/DnrJ/EryC1/StrS aminotransferase family protein [Candidatus Omnitrophica bacterium]|nr:DegT/DnrJ/EryC1/StrS aminotransferase family protein [Candidatus Omnitrophota bacterium]MDD5592752.1 DegT/DnrJ/EryC1/StrS aminotransferase family protein [Candidatus Omnitrophota bacterium]